MKDKQIKGFYKFASFRLDVKSSRLTFNGETISLTPKEFGVLLYLIENSDRTVEKDELLDEIWKDTFVEEATLTRNISWLRRKLVAHTDVKIIETVPKRGYRFLPEINSIDENELAVSKSENGEVAQILDEKVLPLSENALNLTEQTVRRIEVEEVIEISPSSNDNELSIVDGKIVEVPKNRKALATSVNKRQFSIFLLVPVFLVFALAVFAVYRLFFLGNSTQTILATKIVPFSSLPGRELTPAFSPDGNQLVYSWNGGIEDGSLDIYVKMIGAGEPIRLTETANDEINPVFSPDGRSIAFVRNFPDHNEIIMISALGGAEQKIYDRASYASLSFSPDGKYLAHTNLDTSSNETGVFLIDLQSNERKRLTMPENQIVDHTPRFSPDGKNLAFIRHFTSFQREIFVVPVSGGEVRQITKDNVRIYGLAWNNTGENLLYTSFREADRLNLWQVSTTGGEPQLISTGSKEMQSLAVSPNGKIIAFTEEIMDDNIWEISADKSRPIIHSTKADHSQQYSPDGNRIVFSSDRTGNYEIWISDADGKHQRQLTDSKDSKGSPRFSPDGQFIAFDAQAADKSDVYLISVNGGEARKLTESDKNSSLPAWSVDGKTIFYVSNRSGSDQIWKMPVSGGESTQITKQGAFEMFAAADGKTIIYAKESGKPGIWSVGINGTDEKPIPELKDVGKLRSWFVGTKGVYFTTYTNQPMFSIRFMDFASRQISQVSNEAKPPLLYYPNLSVSADGKKILYARQDQSASSILFAVLEN